MSTYTSTTDERGRSGLAQTKFRVIAALAADGPVEGPETLLSDG